MCDSVAVQLHDRDYGFGLGLCEDGGWWMEDGLYSSLAKEGWE